MTEIACTYTDWHTEKSMLECNKYMLEHGIASDITFLVGKNREEIRAHKYILISRSSIFEAMFCGSMAETQTEIPIPDIEIEAFKILLSYVYCDESSLDGNLDVIQVLYAAKKYCVEGLVKDCTRAIGKMLDMNNACLLLESANLFDESGLHQMCYEFVLEHGEECLQSDSFCQLSVETVEKIFDAEDLHADELTVWKSLLKWAKGRCEKEGEIVNNENMRSIIGDLLYYVRFRAITAENFAKFVSVAGILSEIELVSVFQFYHGACDSLGKFCMKSERCWYHRCLRLKEWPAQPVPVFTAQNNIAFSVSSSVSLCGIILNMPESSARNIYMDNCPTPLKCTLSAKQDIVARQTIDILFHEKKKLTANPYVLHLSNEQSTFAHNTSIRRRITIQQLSPGPLYSRTTCYKIKDNTIAFYQYNNPQSLIFGLLLQM